MAREGLRRWPDGDRGWKFRLLCTEDLIPLARLKEACALLEPAGTPTDASLQARLKMDRARLALSAEPVSYTHLDVYKRQITMLPLATSRGPNSNTTGTPRRSQ